MESDDSLVHAILGADSPRRRRRDAGACAALTPTSDSRHSALWSGQACVAASAAGRLLLLRFAAGRAACGGRAAAGRAAGARGVRDVRVVAGSNGDVADCKSTDDLPT